ncbi:MAG: insulinase family protein, partial [Spirochaetales bacterium]
MKSVHGFQLLEEHSLPEHRARGFWYRHEATGAQVFHMHTDDPENLFAFAFKTLPSDSTGVAHILEHTVLCGSRHFPVKDPFIRLVQGSLNTFVNAMTYPDKTVYPAASTVEQDLFNIMQVYGDAVFFPLLKEAFFKQEGHRLQFDGEDKLELTGIVYNEMKGNYSDHDNIVGRSVHRYLMPDTVYGHDSGGDPASIPDLTYEDFLGFHRTYYHPSNARIFLYGDIPSDRYLDFLNREFLSHFERLEAGVKIERQPRWGEPREQVITCPADGESGTTTITMSWLLDPEPDERSMLEFELLSYILLGSSAGPLRKRLIESGLGDDLSAASGTETGLREMIFGVGLRGTAPDKKEAVSSLILDSLRVIATEGISSDLVEASLRKVEFRHREIKGGIPNGLRFMDRSLRGWLHGRTPYETLHFEDPFEAIRGEIKPGSRFFEKLIENHLLGNQHRLVTVVRPDSKHREREQAQVAARLADIESGFSEEDREHLRGEQAELEELQSAPDSPEAIASLPFLKTSDLPRELENI